MGGAAVPGARPWGRPFYAESSPPLPDRESRPLDHPPPPGSSPTAIRWRLAPRNVSKVRHRGIRAGTAEPAASQSPARPQGPHNEPRVRRNRLATSEPGDAVAAADAGTPWCASGRTKPVDRRRTNRGATISYLVQQGETAVLLDSSRSGTVTLLACSSSTQRASRARLRRRSQAGESSSCACGLRLVRRLGCRGQLH
jgi:hypothetical protein